MYETVFNMADKSNGGFSLVSNLINQHDVIVFSDSRCPYCCKLFEFFQTSKIEFTTFDIEEQAEGKSMRKALYEKSRQTSVPNVFIFGTHIGGYEDVMNRFRDGTLQQYLDGRYKNFDYDLIIIGCGSGGVAAAKEASLLNKKVAVFDFVKPSKEGHVWGVGGTCLNVGCVPKRLIHQAAAIGEYMEESSSFGWTGVKKEHDWGAMITEIRKYIKLMTFNYLKIFKKLNISYFKAFVKFKDIHTIQATDEKGITTEHTAFRFILACGCRPFVPDFEGNNLAITSDDFFFHKTKPGKTLIIGGSFISVEFAGFLNSFGVPCTVLARSRILHDFDNQVVTKLQKHMTSLGIVFIVGYVPHSISDETETESDSNKRYKVTMVPFVNKSLSTKEDYFNLVIMATGRHALTNGMGLENIGIIPNEFHGRIKTDKYDMTACHTVCAIGDVQEGHHQLTPVATKSALLAVQRMFSEGIPMDYSLIPMTVFAPLEYGFCGLSEEAAALSKDISYKVFYKEFKPLEWSLSKRQSLKCLAKLVVDKKNNDRVIGIHILGPCAGEIIQGFALAMKLNAKKLDFDGLVGIHPTSAEVFTNLTFQKITDIPVLSC